VAQPVPQPARHRLAYRARGYARAGLLACALAAALASPLHAQKTDVVTLKNGDRITGEVKKLERGLLEYKTDDMGTIYVDWNKIARLTSRNYFEVELESGRKYFGALDESGEDGKMVVSLAVSDTVDILPVVRITRIKTTFWSRLGGYVDLGFSYAKANKNVQFSTSAEVRYRGRKFYGSLAGESYFQSQTGSEGTSRNSLTFTLQRYLGNKWALGGNVRFEQNQEQQLDSRFSIGAAGWRAAVQTNRVVLLLLAGVQASSEKFVGGSAHFSAELAAGYDFSLFKFHNPKTDITSTLHLYGSMTDFGRFRFDFDVRLKYELFKDFYLGVTFFDKFDSRPGTVEGGVSNDLGTTLSIGYSF